MRFCHISICIDVYLNPYADFHSIKLLSKLKLRFKPDNEMVSEPRYEKTVCENKAADRGDR